jgi:Asp-tRNA(Asn)/Glu-tRNA(Gln) amidotransferase A subunit family amidase
MCRNSTGQVEAATAKAAQVFGELGAIVEQADPGFPEPYEMIMTLWGAVSAMVVAAAPESERAKMDPGFLRLAEEGKRYSLADYLAAYTARQELANVMARFHEKYDLLLTPQMPIPAFEVGRVTPADGSYGERWIAWSPYTYPFNLTQQPAPRCRAASRPTACRSGCRSSARRGAIIWCCAPHAPTKARVRSPLSTPRDKIDLFQTGVVRPLALR